MPVDLPSDKKTVKNQDWVTGLPGSRAAGPPGCGPSWAMGHWATGLLLAKPKLKVPTVSTIKGIDCKYLYGTFNKLYAPYKNKTSR